MGYKDRFLTGEFPESGAIFICNTRTKEECLKRKLFGLPSNMTDLVLNVRKGMTLFLFEYESRLLHGVFRATSDGRLNIDPEAFRSSGKHFPAQVRFKTIMHCNPLEEYDFKYAIRDNYFSGNKFRFGLNEKQVSKLFNLFRSKEILKKHPERTRDSRSDRYRKNLFQKRLGSINKEDFEFEDEDVKRRDGRLMKEKTKRERDFEDRYLPVSSESYEKHYGEIGVGRNNENIQMDGDRNRFRFQDEYNVSEGLRKSLSSYHRGSPCDRGSQSVTDKYSFGLETVESEQKLLNEQSLSKTSYDGSCTLRPITSNEHIISKQRKAYFECKPDDDDDGSFRLRSVSPTAFSFIREPILTHDYSSSSHFSQNAYSTSCDPTRIETPEIRFSPSHFADGSNFIPIDNSQCYPISEKILTVLPLSKSPPYQSHNEGSARYFDDFGYALLDSRQHTVEGNPEVREFKTVSREGSYNPLFPEFITKKLSSDAGLSLYEDDYPENDKRFSQAHERKHTFGTDTRVSVFSRLNSALRHGNQESETDEKHELDASVNKVMRMLEKVASSPIRRKGKSKSAFKDNDDNNPRDSELVEYELPDVPTELDTDPADDISEDESILPETRLLDYKRRKKAFKSIDGSVMSSKRRKIVRPTFVEKTSTADDITCFLDDNVSEKVVLENSEKVKDDSNSTKKVDAFMKSIEDIVLSKSHEYSPDNNKSPKVILESSQKAETSIEHNDINVVPTSHEITPSKDVCNLTEAVPESSEKVETSIEHNDINVVPTSHEITPSKDVCNITEAVPESSEKVDVVEVCTDVEKVGKWENRPVLDFFVEANPEASSKNDQKMCGWIEW